MRGCTVVGVVFASAASASSALAADETIAIEGDGTSWRQIMMAPHITGDLRAVAVDPTDAKNIYVATTEGTLAHSTDGGVTWNEIAMTPFYRKSPAISVSPSGDEYNALAPFGGLQVLVGNQYKPLPPIGRPNADRQVSPASPKLDPLPPYFINPFRFDSTQEVLLGQVAGADAAPIEVITRVRVCPGGNYLIYAVTAERLWASSDGTNFLTIFTARATDPIADVACAPANPNDVVIATGDGTYRSKDGGLTFTQLGGWVGPAGGQAVAWGPPGQNGAPQLFIASGTDIFGGDPDDADNMRYMPLTGAGDIAQLAATSKSVWAPTSTGVYASQDGGNTFTSVPDLESLPWITAAVIPSEGDVPEHVAITGEDMAFDSDDSVHFRPFFRGETRRKIKYIVASPGTTATPPGFLILSAGELWTTRSSEPVARAVGGDKRRWAARKLENLPSLGDTLAQAFTLAGLTSAQVNDMFGALKARALVPSVLLNIQYNGESSGNTERTYLTDPNTIATNPFSRGLVASVDFVWELPDLFWPSYNFTPVRQDLYELRKRFQYVIEDAYTERRQILTQMMNETEESQWLTLEARLDVLNTVLEQFTGVTQR
jgi:hypothetical protein